MYSPLILALAITVARSSRGLGAAVGGDLPEIGAEIVDDHLDHGGELFRCERIPDPRRIGILRAEQLLGEL